MSLLYVVLFAAATCPASSPSSNTPGLAQVAPLPAESAMRLNGEGKRLYREERWNLAEEKYRAALATDPDFGGAQLNLACCLARQGRFDKAAEEASALIRRAYVPWAREVVEAADLGILQGRKEEAKIGAARGEASLEWGQRAQSGIFFVARTRPPVRLAGEGLLLLHLNQEIFAWIPETGRYFQLTAEDGHVLALVVSPDGRKIAYILGGKLGRYPGRVPFLRGLFLRVLDIPSMALSTSATIPGDVQRISLSFPALHPEVAVTDTSGTITNLRMEGDALQPISGVASLSARQAIVLTGWGGQMETRRMERRSCAFVLSTERGADGIPNVRVTPTRSKGFFLSAKYGAGLSSLPFFEKGPQQEAKAKP